MTTAAMIPARGGSRGIKRKNIKEFCGKPLLLWSVEQARDAQSVDRVIVSTEDVEIAGLARDHGVDVLGRPPELATDTATTREVEEHFLSEIDCDVLVTLHPTSPLRLPQDIDNCVYRLSWARECRSVTEAEAHPALLFEADVSGHLTPYRGDSHEDRTARQDWDTLYRDNGAVWAREVDPDGATGLAGHVMPSERSVDIDTPHDWRVAEFLMRDRIAEQEPISVA